MYLIFWAVSAILTVSLEMHVKSVLAVLDVLWVLAMLAVFDLWLVTLEFWSLSFDFCLLSFEFWFLTFGFWFWTFNFCFFTFGFCLTFDFWLLTRAKLDEPEIPDLKLWPRNVAVISFTFMWRLYPAHLCGGYLLYIYLAVISLTILFAPLLVNGSQITHCRAHPLGWPNFHQLGWH